MNIQMPEGEPNPFTSLARLVNENVKRTIKRISAKRKSIRRKRAATEWKRMKGNGKYSYKIHQEKWKRD